LPVRNHLFLEPLQQMSQESLGDRDGSPVVRPAGIELQHGELRIVQAADRLGVPKGPGETEEGGPPLRKEALQIHLRGGCQVKGAALRRILVGFNVMGLEDLEMRFRDQRVCKDGNIDLQILFSLKEAPRLLK
jgi:hypothetical protein